MNDWPSFLANEKQEPYLKETLTYIEKQREQGVVIYPKEQDVFNAFAATPFDDVKVVILGQDPYHGPDQAHGLAFSVNRDIKIPPSLVNMYKELATDIDGFTIPAHGNLQSWAEQGVLLLNTVLTVEQGKAHSHKHLGWETFTDKVLAHINQHKNGVVFILWGAHAQKKGKFLDTGKHVVLKGPHPSPLSAYRGFFGCQHFSLTNDALAKQHKSGINWQV